MQKNTIVGIIISAMDNTPEAFVISRDGDIIAKDHGYRVSDRILGGRYLAAPFYYEFSVFENIRMRRAVKRHRLWTVQRDLGKEAEKE